MAANGVPTYPRLTYLNRWAALFSQSSVRNRLFLVIAGMAVLAALSIAVEYVTSETESVDIDVDSQAISELYDMTVRLSTQVRDQEAAVDHYLLAASPELLVPYHDAVAGELALAERVRVVAVEMDEYPAVPAAFEAIFAEARAWRIKFAEPAIAAVDRGSRIEISRITALMGADLDATMAALDQLAISLADANRAMAERHVALNRTRGLAVGVSIGLMFIGAAASLVLARRWVTHPLGRLLATAQVVESGADEAFITERNDEIGRLGGALEGMRAALQQDADRSSVLNRFNEVTTFALDDAAVASASLEALMLLVRPDAAVTHVLNPSKDRAVPEATLGSAVAEVLPMNAMSRCPAIVRGSLYVTPDVSAPLSVHCPVYPVEHGTLACVPLAHGETVGVVHLHWERPHAFGLEPRASVGRVAEHAALAIANRRLLAALQGMAGTDARTGLSNVRTFDQLMEDALNARRNEESIAVLMVDVDHFKDFNDRHGHPAGDEALRAFADILRSCLRDGDVAARYGGEEFAVALPDVDEATALAVAERIRSRTESTVISLGPGITDRISVSIGVAIAPNQARDRVTLLRLADEALYRAKQSGRNRVLLAGAESVDAPATSVPGDLRPLASPTVKRTSKAARGEAAS